MALYKYGMRLRGFSPGAQPMKNLKTATRFPAEGYHSVLWYTEPLSAEDVRDYELDYLGEVEDGQTYLEWGRGGRK